MAPSIPASSGEFVGLDDASLPEGDRGEASSGNDPARLSPGFVPPCNPSKEVVSEQPATTAMTPKGMPPKEIPTE
jgi:hypothetical protein